jgi:insertion element IS1 protein InsB
LLQAVNQARLTQLEPSQTIVRLCQWEDTEAELDEIWSFVGSKAKQRWLWHGIDHSTGEVLAYVLSSDADEAFLKLKSLLEPFGIMQFYTDGWGAYVGVACRRHYGISMPVFTAWANGILNRLSESI